MATIDVMMVVVELLKVDDYYDDGTQKMLLACPIMMECRRRYDVMMMSYVIHYDRSRDDVRRATPMVNVDALAVVGSLDNAT